MKQSLSMSLWFYQKQLTVEDYIAQLEDKAAEKNGRIVRQTSQDIFGCKAKIPNWFVFEAISSYSLSFSG